LFCHLLSNFFAVKIRKNKKLNDTEMQ